MTISVVVKSVDLTLHLTPKRAKRRDREYYNFMDVPRAPMKTGEVS
jgi:hypothetical protein